MKPIVHLPDEFATLEETWSPRVVGEANQQYVKVARIHGDLAWHSHDDEDELFLIMRGSMVMEYEDRDPVPLREGDLHIVPKGVPHNPVAEEECWVMLVEPRSTKHTGDKVLPQTRSVEQQLGEAGE